MKGISSALGSFFLVLLISSFSFLYIYFVNKTFDSLSSYMMEMENQKERAMENIQILASYINRYLPLSIENNSANIIGTIYDILRGSDIFVYSDRGNLSLVFIFENVSFSNKWAFEMEYKILSNTIRNVTLRIIAEDNEISQIYESSMNISNFSEASNLSIYSNQTIDSNFLKIKIELISSIPSFLMLDIDKVSLKILGDSSHSIFIILFNGGNIETKVSSIILFNDKLFYFYNCTCGLNPSSFKIIILNTDISYGYVKLITQRGNIVFSSLIN